MSLGLVCSEIQGFSTYPGALKEVVNLNGILSAVSFWRFKVGKLGDVVRSNKAIYLRTVNCYYLL